MLTPETKRSLSPGCLSREGQRTPSNFLSFISADGGGFQLRLSLGAPRVSPGE